MTNKDKSISFEKLDNAKKIAEGENIQPAILIKPVTQTEKIKKRNDFLFQMFKLLQDMELADLKKFKKILCQEIASRKIL